MARDPSLPSVPELLRDQLSVPILAQVASQRGDTEK